jgi:hypothetical protein
MAVPRWLGKTWTKGELNQMWYSHRQPWARSAQPPGQTDPTQGKRKKKRIISNNNKKDT